MSFDQTLRECISSLGCSSKELADASRISRSTISRYLSGERKPRPGSEALARLVSGISSLASKASDDACAELVDSTRLLERLSREISGMEADGSDFARNLDSLMNALGMSNNELARELSFDPSYISRIRKGQRQPANTPQFAEGVASYIATHYANSARAGTIALLTGCTFEEASHRKSCFVAMMHFLGSTSTHAAGSMAGFLTKLDEFDPQEYVSAMRLEDIGIGEAEVRLPESSARSFSSLNDIMRAELDFLAAAALSNSNEDVIMYSDMPMMQMARSGDFAMRWMMGLARIVGSGRHLCIIHDVYRPMEEMATGLELWIPLYMTGLVSSYYLPQPTNSSFTHYLRSADNAALWGEGIAGHLERGRFVFTTRADDIAYYRTRARLLLRGALPLMRTFREDQSDESDELERAIEQARGDADGDAIHVGEVVFSNIDIEVLPGHYALVRKHNAPAMSFLIEQPLLVNAIAAFQPTLVD